MKLVSSPGGSCQQFLECKKTAERRVFCVTFFISAVISAPAITFFSLAMCAYGVTVADRFCEGEEGDRTCSQVFCTGAELWHQSVVTSVG